MEEQIMKKEEKAICEAIDTYFQEPAELGLSAHKHEEDAHVFQHMHEEINQLFNLKAVDMTHHDGICSAFRKVHNYKYLDDPTFREAMRKELSAQAVPAEERERALDLIPKIIEEMREEDKAWAEKDAGWNPNLKEISLAKAHTALDVPPSMKKTV
jgi:hypothetical protein